MKKAMISELKNRLSHYLRFVRRGESVVIYDRTRPIARIDPIRSPAAAADEEDWTAEAIRSGALRAPTTTLSSTWLADRPETSADVVAAVLEERDDGR